VLRYPPTVSILFEFNIAEGLLQHSLTNGGRYSNMPIIDDEPSGKMVVGYRPTPYIYHQAGSSGVDEVNFPVTDRMNYLNSFRRSTRTNTILGDPTIAIDFEAPVSVQAVSLEHMNFQSLSLEVSEDGFTWVNFSSGIFGTDAEDDEDERRKLVIISAAPMENIRFMRFQPLQPDANDNFFMIGSCAVWSEVEYLAENPFMPYRKQHDDEAQIDRLLGSGEDISGTSPIQLVISFPFKHEMNNLQAKSQYHRIIHSPRNRVMLWYENQGDATKMYHVRRSNVGSTTRQPNVLDYDTIQLREVG
jgi:hypothetical protein